MTGITLLDGGMGKELRRIGAPFRQPEWSALALMEAPDFVVQAHTNFIQAGAETITTSNYAVVPFHLGDDRFRHEGRELIDLAGKLARQAASDSDRRIQVAGSLPPLFGSYEPDKFDPIRAPACYHTMIEALEPSVDFWIAETMSSVAELHTIVETLGCVGSKKPLWASFTLPNRSADDVVALHSQETVAEIVAGVNAYPEQIEAVLFNCAAAEQIGPALLELAMVLKSRGLALRVGGYANGFPDDRDEDGYTAKSTIFERREDLGAEVYADIVGEWITAGATIIGGCCDIYPDDIATLHRRFL